MLQLVSVPALTFTTSLATSSAGASPLEQIFHRVRLNMVHFTAKDIYQLCTIAYNADSVGMMRDADFMRGIGDAFARCDQSVLTPFQTSLITDTLRQAGINISPKEVAVPEEEAVSPESLLNVLVAMSVARKRDERKITKVIQLMSPMLDEFTPTQVSLAISELARLECLNGDILSRLAQRFFQFKDQVEALDVSVAAKGLALSRGVPLHTLRRMFALVEEYLPQFQPEDYLNVLKGLQRLGPLYMKPFTTLVTAGLNHVENMDAGTLAQYMICFTTMEGYRPKEHIEIFADALVDVATDLSEQELVQTFVALKRLQLLNDELCTVILSGLMSYAYEMSPRHIAPVMDVCSSLSQPTDSLMRVLLDRATECTRVLSAYQLAEILEIIAQYPPAKEHPLVEMFGKQARLRIEIMSSEDLARATRGLATLGYKDAEFYAQVAETAFRYGFKGWSQLEPIMLGLCISDSSSCPITTVKVITSHLAPMARSMNMAEIERANRYLVVMQCEEDYVYRALAHRVMQFVKEVTPDTPEELQILLQRGAINHQRG